MKKILTYFAIALLSISCASDLELEDLQQIHFDLSGSLVRLRPGILSRMVISMSIKT